MSHRKDRELQEELRAHLEMATRDRIERGEDPIEAAAAARREFGNVALVQEVTRDAWGWMWLERLAQDLRYAARLLHRTPAFTFVAVLSLALGIGASAAIFQVIDALRLRALPVARPQELVEIAPASMEGARGNFANWRAGVTNPIWEQLRDEREAFSGMLAWGSSSFNLASGGEVQSARGLWVSGAFFNVLGIHPERGRLLSPGDDRRGCEARAVVSHQFWQRQFGGDPAIVGRTLSLDSTPVEIVGVTPASFFGLEVGRTFDVALPICAEAALAGGSSQLDSGASWWLTVVGRLKPGVTSDRANARLRSLSAGIFRATLAPNYPQVSVPKYLAMTLQAAPVGTGVSYLREQYGTPLWLLLTLAASVLIIGCANLANLMLARASAREREIAIRLGLGASRARVMRQLLTESVVLAAAGAAGGLIVSRLLSRALCRWSTPTPMPCFWSSGWTGMCSGLRRRWQQRRACCSGSCRHRATRTSPAAVMNTAGRGLTASREGVGLCRVLVIAQVAVSLLLLAGALLFTRTLMNLTGIDAGFTRDGIMMTQVDFRAARVPAERRAAHKVAILSRIRALPGVEFAAVTALTPVGGNTWGNDVTVQTAAGPKTANARFNRVTDGYFVTFRTPLIAGRDFDPRDGRTVPKVAIVNQVFVRELFGGANAIGRRFTVEATPTLPATEMRSWVSRRQPNTGRFARTRRRLPTCRCRRSRGRV
jgi:predicted permease